MKLKVYIQIIALFYAIQMFAQTPMKVRLKESIKAPLIMSRKEVGEWELTKGTELAVRSVAEDTITLDNRGTPLMISILKTDYAEQKAAATKRAEEQRQQAEKARIAELNKQHAEEAMFHTELRKEREMGVAELIQVKKVLNRQIGTMDYMANLAFDGQLWMFWADYAPISLTSDREIKKWLNDTFVTREFETNNVNDAISIYNKFFSWRDTARKERAEVFQKEIGIAGATTEVFCWDGMNARLSKLDETEIGLLLELFKDRDKMAKQWEQKKRKALKEKERFK
jgi:hypothetical protein